MAAKKKVAVTKAQLEKMATAELIKLYNELAQKNIKRFSSRGTGMKMLLALQPPGKARTVSGKEKKSNRGRKPIDFEVKLKPEGTGKSKVHGDSLRGKLLVHLSEKGGTLKLSQINEHFSRDMSGPVQKLLAKRHVDRIELAKAAA